MTCTDIRETIDTASVYVDAAPGRPADIQTIGAHHVPGRMQTRRLVLLPTHGSALGHPYWLADAQPHCDSGRIVARKP